MPFPGLMVSKFHVRAALALGGLFLALYVFTLSQHYTGDSLMFATEIRTGRLAAMMPRHRALADVLGYMFVSVWNLITGETALLEPLQVFNALCGAVAVVLVFYILRSLTAATPVALLVALGFGTSNGIWLFSIEAEMVTPALAQMLAVLLVAVGFVMTGPVRYPQVIVAGLLTSFAVLTYFESVLLIPIVIVALALSDEAVPRSGMCQQV